uniref:Uncharacterized protein n=1 Tax=Anguilla anguilla TaxID=7936 RepID=A0A0E9Q422_ANGAN
MKICVFISI